MDPIVINLTQQPFDVLETFPVQAAKVIYREIPRHERLEFWSLKKCLDMLNQVFLDFSNLENFNTLGQCYVRAPMNVQGFAMCAAIAAMFPFTEILFCQKNQDGEYDRSMYVSLRDFESFGRHWYESWLHDKQEGV